jgi:hypothetical protein
MEETRWARTPTSGLDLWSSEVLIDPWEIA